MGPQPDDGRGPDIPPSHVSVAVHRCERPARPVSVAYPGMRGGHMLLLQRSGAFHLKSSQHRLLVDPTVSVIGRAGEPADIAHPHGRGDVATYIVVSPEVFESFAWADAPVSGLAPVTGQVARLHQHLVRVHAPLDGSMALEDAAIRLFVAALSGADPRRSEPPSLGARRQEQIVDDTRGVLAADPTIDSLVLLSRMVGCSPHHLSRLFHRRMGKTLVQHRLELRVHRALERLRDQDATLAEVAADAGFADHAHLTRSFRRFLGATPSELRQCADGGC